MNAAIILAFISLASEALKTFNLIYSDLPVEQRREQARLHWLVVKPMFDWAIHEMEKSERSQ